MSVQREAWRKQRNALICTDKTLLSLLYDLDLLPEQVEKESLSEFKLDTVVAHWMGRVASDKPTPPSTPSP